MQVEDEYEQRVVTFTTGDKEALDILERELDKRTVYRFTDENWSSTDIQNMPTPYIEGVIDSIRKKLAIDSEPDMHDACNDEHDAIYRFMDYYKTMTGRDESNAFNCGAIEAIRFIYLPQRIVEEIEERKKHE